VNNIKFERTIKAKDMDTKFNFNRILLIFILLANTSCVGTFYVVRHAEKLNGSDDTPLSAAGFARAETLADSLFGKGIDSIFVSPRLRTRQTAAPLAQRLNEQMVVYGFDSVASFTRRIKSLKKSVLIVGHTNTIPTIIDILSGETVVINENNFDNLYKITIKRNWLGQTSTTFNRGKYGVLTP
jgi:broad specificity phosphatase PhoE